MKDHGTEQDTQTSKDDSCQRNLPERLDKHRTSLPGMHYSKLEFLWQRFISVFFYYNKCHLYTLS